MLHESRGCGRDWLTRRGLVHGHAGSIVGIAIRFGNLQRPRVGERFPDFCLPDSENRPVTLAAMLGRGPALMVFYKGDW